MKTTRLPHTIAANAANAIRQGGQTSLPAALFLAVAVCFAWVSPLEADTVTLTASDAGNQSSLLDDGARWSDGQAAHAGSDYVVNGVNLRTPTMSTGEWPADRTLVFAGDSLTISGSRGQLLLKAVRTPINANTDETTVLPKIVINDLRLVGEGNVDGNFATINMNQGYRDMNTIILAGNITLVSGTSIFAVLLTDAATPGALIVESNISGAADLAVSNGAAENNLKGQVITFSGSNTYTGATDIIKDAVLKLGSADALGNTSRLSLTGSSKLDVNGFDAHVGMLAGSSGTALITSQTATTASSIISSFDSGTSTYAGRIANGAAVLSFIKSGSGTLILSGSNSHTGATTVDGGRLLINGNHANATGLVTAAAGGVLGGTGTLGGIARVENGGTLIGRAGDVFTLRGLELNASSNIDITLGAPSADALFQVNGDLILDGYLNITDAGGFAPGLYRIINYTGALTDNGLSFGSLPFANMEVLLNIDTSAAGQISLAYGVADYWDNGSGVWNATNTNWTDVAGSASSAWGGAYAIFRNTAGTVTVDNGAGPVAFTGAQFAADGFLLTGGTLALNGTVVLRVGDGTPVGAIMSATIATIMSGAGGIEKADLGTLLLAGNNTYTGATSVKAGTLLINGDQSAATGVVTVKANGALGGAGTLGGPVQVENGGALGGAQDSTLTMQGLVFDADANLNISLGAPGNATALLQVNGDLVLDGQLNIADAGGFGAGLYRIIDYTGNLTDNGLEIGGVPAPGTEPLLSIETGNAGRVNLLHGEADIWNDGNGTWNSGSLWSGGSSVQWNSGFVIFRNDSGTIAVDNAAGPVVFTGAQFAADGFLIDGGTLTTNTPGGVLRVGDGSEAGALFTATIAATIGGSGGIEKMDLGTLVLEGNNTYAGTTVIKGGSLLVNGYQSAATGDVTVKAGGALGGAGIIGANVAIEDDGVLLGRSGTTLTIGSLAPGGASPAAAALGAPSETGGTLPTMRGLALSDSSLINVTLGAPSETALFQVNGDLILDGLLNVTDAGGLGPGLYRIFNYTGALVDNGLEFGQMPPGATGAESLLTIDTTTTGRVNLLYGTADFWTGGSGIWDAGSTNTNWKDSGGTAKAWGGSFAIFNTGAGTVTINGSEAEPVIFNGAQFATSGYTIAGNMIVASVDPSIIRVGDGSEAGAAMTATIMAEIGGAGGIDKTDLGTLVISGSVNRNTYTGATRIKGGTLRLADGGSISDTIIMAATRLEGSGEVRGSLANDGVFAPAAASGAAVHVSGNYTQTAGGTMVAMLTSATTFSRIRVDGSATLDGDLVVVIPETGFVPIPGLACTIIDAGVSVSGTFANMDAPWGRLSQMVLFEVLYGACDVRLSFTQLPFAQLAGTENQRAVGAGLDAAITRGAIPGLQGALNTLQTEAEVLAALTVLSPRAYERYFTQAISAVDAGVRSIEGRLASTPFAPENKWSLWAEAVARGGSFAGDDDAGVAGADFRSYGVQAGVDRTFGDRLKLGLFLSITDDDLDRHLQVTRQLAGLYARYTLGGAFADVVAGGGFENIDASRVTTIPGRAGMSAYPGLASANADAGEYFASMRLGYAFTPGKNTRLTPYAALQYTHWEADAFNESGARDASLRVHKMKGESLATRLGFEWSQSFAVKKTKFTPRLNLAWRHEYEDEAREITAEIGGCPFAVPTTKPEENGVLAALTLDVALSPRVMVWLGCVYEHSTATKNALDTNAGIMYKF